MDPASLLARYEEQYGLDGYSGSSDNSIAFAPYPASVRARRLAVAYAQTRKDIRRALAQAARAILRKPELHLLGNHWLENGFGLASAASVTQGVESDFWWSIGARILHSQLKEQFLPDGGHRCL